ncbi:hypothetical protein [Cytobacillus purgationiresistens]|uniref:DNA-binding protein n=1 Tax=Cytobacillus purgationiresistens TaxID=863449 RepID=A0ABU0ALM7_9BACI|nr:hypothetical protein [Cytobacillus purgationiresistens]MDQ0271672.1 hypothetical protein [Cytobacillus purgationiresistens]
MKETSIYYFNLNRSVITELLAKYPNAPKIILNGQTYYPSSQFQEWLTKIDFRDE